MATKPSKDLDYLDAQNAGVLAEIITDPQTSDALRIQILNKLLAISEGQTFFQTILKEELSKGECPSCGHVNHWLVPEDELARMKWVTHEEDPRVTRTTDKKSCNKWAESCKKKKVSI